MVILSLTPLALLSGMARADDSESQKSSFIVGAGVGARSCEKKGTKIYRTGEIVEEAETGISGMVVAIGVTVEVGVVVVIMLVGDRANVGEIVPVITATAAGLSVIDGATGVVSKSGASGVSSVIVN